VSRQLGPTDLKRLHREWRRRTEGRVALVLDGVQSPFNVGSIIRTAAAYRVDRLWLAAATPLPSTAGVRKVSMGTDRYVEWSAAESGAVAVAAARADGYRVVGVELAAEARPLHELPVGDAVCLVIGHEDRGIATTTLAVCDEVAFLPQLGRVGSLNVAVAAGIALYEVRRRAWSTS
jgi:tRNA (guanosine-2'-O-)-methyltransferase